MCGRSPRPVKPDSTLQHQRLTGLGQCGHVGVGDMSHLPRFDVQPPSFCGDSLSGECSGDEPPPSTGCVGGNGKLGVPGPWPTSCCYMSSIGSQLGTLSVTFERSSFSPEGTTDKYSDHTEHEHRITCESTL